jgi:hypothetical protein
VAVVELEVDFPQLEPPPRIANFLDEANDRVEEFLQNVRVRQASFVPSDFNAVYDALRVIVDQSLAPGHVFCEWGSGVGVVACLAALLEFEASGIEIQDHLVEAARELAEDFELDVEFITGSFIPSGGQSRVDENFEHDAHWIDGEADNSYEELGVAPEEFDVFFAYPWPGEEHVISELFDFCAADGALLLMYTAMDGVRMQRKVADDD